MLFTLLQVVTDRLAQNPSPRITTVIAINATLLRIMWR